MRPDKDQGHRSKKVPPEVGEPLKKHPKRKDLRVAVNLQTIEGLMK